FANISWQPSGSFPAIPRGFVRAPVCREPENGRRGSTTAASDPGFSLRPSQTMPRVLNLEVTDIGDCRSADPSAQRFTFSPTVNRRRPSTSPDSRRGPGGGPRPSRRPWLLPPSHRGRPSPPLRRYGNGGFWRRRIADGRGRPRAAPC